LNWIHYQTPPISDDQEDEADEDDHHQAGKDDYKASRRSLAYLGAAPQVRIPSPELDRTLRRIDEWSPSQSNGLHYGRFSVFTASGEKSALTETATHQDNVHDNKLSTETDLSLAWDEDHSHPTNPNLIASTIQSLPSQQYSHGPRSHLDALTMPSGPKRLIHHWVTFTSRKIALLDEPHNPCRTMMLPMALKGLMSSAQESNADVAIFHALCAAAAFNLYELSGRTSEQDRDQALHHDQQAIYHLRHNLTRAEEQPDQSVAMAIMACIAVEAISGTTKRWRTHVSGGLAYLDKLFSQGVNEALLAPFQRHMVSMAILCDFPVPDASKSFLNDPRVQGLEFTFPYYGISRSFLRAHDRMNMFASAAAAASSAELASLQTEMDAFELQLYLDFPSIPPQDLSSPPKVQGIILHHVAKVFYYAGLVFFQRSIRRNSVDAVQSLVELGVRELESLEQVGKGELGCMMVWPVLVLGAECDSRDVQQRMRAWFRNHRKLGFRNLVVLEELVDTVWRARTDSAADVSNIDWRDIIVLAQFDVLRL